MDCYNWGNCVVLLWQQCHHAGVQHTLADSVPACLYIQRVLAYQLQEHNKRTTTHVEPRLLAPPHILLHLTCAAGQRAAILAPAVHHIQQRHKLHACSLPLHHHHHRLLPMVPLIANSAQGNRARAGGE